VTEERVPLFVRIPAERARQLATSARAAGKAKQDFIADLIEGHPTKPAPVDSTGVPEILTLDDLVAFLRIERADVLSRLAAGELPARRFGSEWRFSRTAILQWMEGTDRPDRRTGFGSTAAAP
jgi:excisionase family DNA binding protein